MRLSKAHTPKSTALFAGHHQDDDQILRWNPDLDLKPALSMSVNSNLETKGFGRLLESPSLAKHPIYTCSARIGHDAACRGRRSRNS